MGPIDLAPTLLELAGLPIPATFEGRSLASLARGDSDSAPAQDVFMESGYVEPTQLTVRRGRWKLIHVRAETDRAAMAGSEFELYDLEADPGETRNLARAHPKRVRDLARALHAWYKGGPRFAEPARRAKTEDLDPRAVEMLRALGYID